MSASASIAHALHEGLNDRNGGQFRSLIRGENGCGQRRFAMSRVDAAVVPALQALLAVRCVPRVHFVSRCCPFGTRVAGYIDLSIALASTQLTGIAKLRKIRPREF